MIFNDDGGLRPDILGSMNIIGKGDRRGADMEFICKKCKRYLTTIKVNPYCTIDIRIECKNCGMVGEGRNLWGEMVGKD